MMGETGRTRAPVALFIFNRPEMTRRVLEAIALVRPQVLLVVADGPRADRPEDQGLCQETRNLVEQVDWPCQVSVNYSLTNLGCKRRIASGLDWVFSQVSEAVVLEDDCVPHPSFFAFCEEMLARYRYDERVHMIRGCNLLRGHRVDTDSYYFSRFYNVWGWATWARAWKHFDLEMKQWPELRKTTWVEQHLPTAAMARMARYIFDETYAGRFTTWDYQWVLAGWLQNALAVVPSHNLVTNIGYGVAATHTQNGDDPLGKLETEVIPFPLSHPAKVEVCEEADRLEWELLNPDHSRLRSLARRLSNHMRMVLGGHRAFTR